MPPHARQGHIYIAYHRAVLCCIATAIPLFVDSAMQQRDAYRIEVLSNSNSSRFLAERRSASFQAGCREFESRLPLHKRRFEFDKSGFEQFRAGSIALLIDPKMCGNSAPKLAFLHKTATFRIALYRRGSGERRWPT
jgi:hypothetical protein